MRHTINRLLLCDKYGMDIGLTLNKLRNSSSGLEYKLQFYVLNETTSQLTFVINLFESEAAPTLLAELTKHLTAPNIERLFI